MKEIKKPTAHTQRKVRVGIKALGDGKTDIRQLPQLRLGDGSPLSFEVVRPAGAQKDQTKGQNPNTTEEAENTEATT